MSNPTLKTNNSKLDIRVKEPSDGAPPTSGIGGPSSDRFKISDYFLTSNMFVKINVSKPFFSFDNTHLLKIKKVYLHKNSLLNCIKNLYSKSFFDR